jgi:hypothetical protein
VDPLTAATVEVDLDDPKRRDHTVRATVEASTALLDEQKRQRLAELGIFAEDETIPISLIAALWQASGDLDESASRLLCRELAQMSLITITAQPTGGAVSMHDVLRSFFRAELNDQAATNGRLVEALGRHLPADEQTGEVAWWSLAADERYLHDHLVYHLLDAGQVDQAERVATDLRWIDTKCRTSGVTVALADLARVPTPAPTTIARCGSGIRAVGRCGPP